MNNNIQTLRANLFATLAALQDKEKPMDIDRAKAISEVAQTIINSAKVEVEHLKISGGDGSGFMMNTIDHDFDEVSSTKKELPSGINSIVRHLIK